VGSCPEGGGKCRTFGAANDREEPGIGRSVGRTDGRTDEDNCQKSASIINEDSAAAAGDSTGADRAPLRGEFRPARKRTDRQVCMTDKKITHSRSTDRSTSCEYSDRLKSLRLAIRRSYSICIIHVMYDQPRRLSEIVTLLSPEAPCQTILGLGCEPTTFC